MLAKRRSDSQFARVMADDPVGPTSASVEGGCSTHIAEGASTGLSPRGAHVEYLRFSVTGSIAASYGRREACMEG